tara:strand:- start:7398 stop:8996 length:1599 start_codon:yes stop_codon:yes gene_type:complete
MNLLTDPFLSISNKQGQEQTLCFAEISHPDFIHLRTPRADFTGAAYQFAIAVLQTCFAPETEQDWEELYQNPPSREQLAQALTKIEHAFHLTGDQPLFMQDFHTLDKIGGLSPVASLLIEAPGGSTLKNNIDHFVKRGTCESMSLPMAALALFTLQTNAPSGGVGHRTGLRGGGPLTNLVMPHDEKASLWQKLWLNVLTQEHVDEKNNKLFNKQPINFHDGSIFPWLAPTKESDKAGSELYPTQVHYLHMYWAMPRRIRLKIDQDIQSCDMTGIMPQQSVSQFWAKNYGHNYSGSWCHPFTHYRRDLKKPEKEDLSTKAQPGGVMYKQWQSLVLAHEDGKEGSIPAQVVMAFEDRAYYFLQNETSYPKLWSFGYDMDNMKARCWYSKEMPLFAKNPDSRAIFLDACKSLIEAVDASVRECRYKIKAALSSRPKDLKGDLSHIDLAFYQQTETAFFDLLGQVAQSGCLSDQMKSTWHRTLEAKSFTLFDQFALTSIEESHLQRRIEQRKRLSLFFHPNSKTFKNFLTNKEHKV